MPKSGNSIKGTGFLNRLFSDSTTPVATLDTAPAATEGLVSGWSFPPDLKVTSFALLLLCLICAQPLFAQTTTGLFGSDEDISIFYDRLEADISTQDGGRSLVVLGNVLLEGRGFSLRADAVGVYVDGVDAESGPVNPKVLAMGGVLLKRGVQTFQAESVFLEVATRRMVLTEARVRLTQELIETLRTLPRDDPRRSRRMAESWVAGVSEVSESGTTVSTLGIAAQFLSVDDFEGIQGRGIVFTTDDFDHPEWALIADKGTASPREEIDQRADEDLPGGYMFEVEDARLEIFGVPVVPFPRTTWDTRWGRSFPLRDLRISDSSRFGSRIDTSWNGDFLIPSRFEDEFDLTPRVDQLSKRGTGYGLDFELGRDPLRWAADPDGRLELFGYGSYWQISDKATQDTDGAVISDPDRFRGRAFLHARFARGTLIDVEYASASDAGFVDEFFRVESRAVKKPENFFSLRQDLGGDYSASVLVESKYEDFAAALEKKPEFRFRALDAPIAGGFRFDSDLVYADLESIPETGSLDPAIEVRRIDIRGEVLRPIVASRWLNVIPSAGLRWTSWTSTNLEEQDRSILSAGVEAATRFSRVFNVRNETLGIEDLRHVVDFRANYSSLFDTTLDVADVPYSMDSIDQLQDRDVVTLSMGHRFQTRQSRTDREKLYRLGNRAVAELRVDALFYPEADRDNAGESWGDLFSEVVIHGSGGWSLFGESRQDLGLGEDRGKNAGLRWLDPSSGLFEASWRNRPEYQETLLMGGRYLASSLWDLGLFVEYDLDNEDVLGQWWEVGRNFRTFRIGFGVDVEAGITDDTTFRVEIGLREWLGALQGGRAGMGSRGRPW